MVCSSLAMTGAARPHMWYYYSGDNFGRKEPQLVSFYERDEKEPVVWESRRGDYVITLWRTVDVLAAANVVLVSTIPCITLLLSSAPKPA